MRFKPSEVLNEYNNFLNTFKASTNFSQALNLDVFEEEENKFISGLKVYCSCSTFKKMKGVEELRLVFIGSFANEATNSIASIKQTDRSNSISG